MNNKITIGEQRALLECALKNLDTIEETQKAQKFYAARGDNEAVHECLRVKLEASQMFAKSLKILVEVHVENAMPLADITVNDNYSEWKRSSQYSQQR